MKKYYEALKRLRQETCPLSELYQTKNEDCDLLEQALILKDNYLFDRNSLIEIKDKLSIENNQLKNDYEALINIIMEAINLLLIDGVNSKKQTRELLEKALKERHKYYE